MGKKGYKKLSIPEELYKKLEDQAKAENLSTQDYFERLLLTRLRALGYPG